VNAAHAEKEIRALARKLGVKAWLVRNAVQSLIDSNGAEDSGNPPAADSAGISTGESHDRNQETRTTETHARKNAGQGRQARLLTRNDLAPRAPVKKDKPVENKSYLRLVAARPCINCGIQGHSQAAHENAGKGKSMKTDDRRTFPLCTVAANGCHEAFDQYRLFSGRAAHVTMGATWSKETREAIRADGLWPKDLEYLQN